MIQADATGSTLNLYRRYTANLSYTWTIERPDGAAPMEFTVHDQVLNRFDHLRCNPQPGLTMSANRRSAGLGEKSTEIRGLIGETGITYQDLHQGRLWGSVITQECCSWDADWAHWIMKNTWFVNDIIYDDRTWTMALTGITSRLKGKRGEVFSRLCQNELGVINQLTGTNIPTSSACPVNVTQYPMTVQNVIVEDSTQSLGYAQDPTKSTIYIYRGGGVDGLAASAHKDGDFSVSYFRHGRVTFKTGALAGLQENVYSEIDVGDAARSTGTRAITFMRPLPDVPARGDELDIVVGCDKTYTTCRDKFDALQGNISTHPSTSGGFRGFPDIPGTDRATTYPPARGQ